MPTQPVVPGLGFFSSFLQVYKPILGELKCKALALNTHQFQNTATFYVQKSVAKRCRPSSYFVTLNKNIAAAMLHRPAAFSANYHI